MKTGLAREEPEGEGCKAVAPVGRQCTGATCASALVPRTCGVPEVLGLSLGDDSTGREFAGAPQGGHFDGSLNQHILTSSFLSNPASLLSLTTLPGPEALTRRLEKPHFTVWANVRNSLPPILLTPSSSPIGPSSSLHLCMSLILNGFVAVSFLFS
eukprot:374035-Pelagomonas_calceolata.AAC.4